MPAPSNCLSFIFEIRGTGSSAVMTIELSRHPVAAQLIVVQLPGNIRNASRCVRGAASGTYAITLKLDVPAMLTEATTFSPACRAEIHAAINRALLASPAVVAILVAEGRASILVRQR